MSDEAFRAAFSGALAAEPTPAFAWETPPLSNRTLDRPFECVLTASPRLARAPADSSPFRRSLAAEPEAQAVAFPNLSGDADLIAPQDLGGGARYGHLADFLRTAPAGQIHALWRLVAETAEPWLAGGGAFWISTAGLGVSWLHVRIDKRPKYYRHEPYRTG